MEKWNTIVYGSTLIDSGIYNNTGASICPAFIGKGFDWSIFKPVPFAGRIYNFLQVFVLLNLYQEKTFISIKVMVIFLWKYAVHFYNAHK